MGAITRQALLLKELISNPRDMGTLCPSSGVLASEMAGALSPRMLREGLCVEIGAGTGPVTRAILDRGVPPERLVVVEKSLPLAELLAERFPGVDVRCCGAEEMGAFVGDTPVSAVVSSLPFRSLPVYTASAIMSEVDRVLSPGGLFIQFTYALVGDMPFIPPHFKKLRTRVVIRNIPPAKVEVFIKPGRRKRENAAAV